MLALSHILSESNEPKLQQLRFEIHDFKGQVLEDIFEKSSKQDIDYVIKSIEGVDINIDNIKS
jgi:hypothetical protein